MLMKDKSFLVISWDDLHKNMIMESAVCNIDDTELVLLHLVSVYFLSVLSLIICACMNTCIHGTYSMCPKVSERNCQFTTFLHYKRTISFAICKSRSCNKAIFMVEILQT